jgi:uncharacterized damage-inducible protein DinB
MGYGAKELAESFRTVRSNTVKIAEDLPADKYDFRAAPGTRSVAELLSHIAVVYAFQYQIHAQERRTTLEGFDFQALIQRLGAEEQKPRTKEQILDLLRTNGETWAKFLESCSDAFLAETIQMRAPAGAAPVAKSRLEMIMSVKEHEMHHRGQLMLIERILGIVPHLTRDMQARHAAMQTQAAAKV